MLVIGHRGAKGIAPENTIEAMQAAVACGVDGLEFDIQLTSDNIPVVIHDKNLHRTHGVRASVAQHTLRDLRELTPDKPIPSLEDVLDLFWGEIYLNIEVKSKGTGLATAKLIQQKYVKQPSDWDNCFISSFHYRELRAVRGHSPRANLAMLHNRNPFTFLAYQRQLNLSAIGFHRLYVNQLAVEIAKKLRLFTYAYTVNRPRGAVLLAQKQVDAVITDLPETILAVTKDL